MTIQVIPLFVLPDIVLPWLGRNGWFEPGHPLRWIADQLFESYDGARGHERAYWRAIGLLLAWPLLRRTTSSTDHPPYCLAGHLVRADVRVHPADRLALGQGGVLRLAL